MGGIAHRVQLVRQPLGREDLCAPQAPLQQAGAADDGGERGAQVMGRGSQEVVPHPHGLLGLAARLLFPGQRDLQVLLTRAQCLHVPLLLGDTGAGIPSKHHDQD